MAYGDVKEPLRKRGRPRKTYNQLLHQKHFMVVEHYMRTGSKVEAMRKAGYAESTAVHMAARVFNREDVKKAIQERRFQAKSRSHMMIDRIQEELANIAFFNIGRVVEITEDGEFIYNFDDATMEDFAAVGEITVETYNEGKGKDARQVKRVKIKPYDKKAALDSLARIHGMFNDNVTLHPGEGGSLEERLAAGRKRLNNPKTIDGDFEEVSRDTTDEGEI